MLRTNGQLPLFAAATRNIAVTTEIENAIRQNWPVAIGVSGGKDSAATGFRIAEYLDSVEHNGPRVLIHSHLGRIEWQKSLPACERLAERLGLELIVVRRKSGDLIDRWRQRWMNNVARYAGLSTVKLIMPWSSATWRFCTSELKTVPICRELVHSTGIRFSIGG